MIVPRCYFWTVLVVTTLSSLNSNYAQDELANDKNFLINSYFNNLYNFSFSHSDSLIIELSKSDIDRATLFNIKADLAWWKLLSGDSANLNSRECSFNTDESIRFNLKNKQRDKSFLFNIIYSYSLKARLESYKGNTLKSIIYFYKSITYIRECIKLPVTDEKVNLVLGLYLYLVDYIKEESNLVSALLFSIPDGDKTKGLEYLEYCSGSIDEMVRTEANYFLFKIHSDLEQDFSKAFHYVRILNEQHPDNLIYNLEHLKLLQILKESDEAQLYRKMLIEKIQKSENINTLQKKHFLSQIDQIFKTGI
jgi:hypothetical protein